MSRPASKEWGIGGRFEELAALQPPHVYPWREKLYVPLKSARKQLLCEYSQWLADNGRNRDSVAVSAISDGTLWPVVSDDAIWFDREYRGRGKYSLQNAIEPGVFSRLTLGTKHQNNPDTIWYDYVIDAVLDLARATLAAREASVSETRPAGGEHVVTSDRDS